MNSGRNGMTSVKPVYPMKLAAVTAYTLRCHRSREALACLAGCSALEAVEAPAMTRRASEPNLHVGVVRDVNAVDEPDPVGIVLHDHRARASAIAEESHAAHQRAVGHAGRGEDDAPAGREIAGAIDLLEVGDPHRAAALLVLRLVDDQARVDLAVEAA